MHFPIVCCRQVSQLAIFMITLYCCKKKMQIKYICLIPNVTVYCSKFVYYVVWRDRYWDELSKTYSNISKLQFVDMSRLQYVQTSVCRSFNMSICQGFNMFKPQYAEASICQYVKASICPNLSMSKPQLFQLIVHFLTMLNCKNCSKCYPILHFNMIHEYCKNIIMKELFFSKK